jgi:DNA-binding CsgD family transcriptional regulator
MTKSSIKALPRTNTQAELFQMESPQPEISLSAFAYEQPFNTLLKLAIEEFIDGILILTDQRELIYVNESARRALKQLHSEQSQSNWIPKEIWYICQSLINSRHLFPNQHWLIESDIFTDDATALHVRVKWLKLEVIAQPYLLISLEDRHQAIRTIAVEQAQHYGLTAREKEVWLLHRASYTYKQIAVELNITPNTVKKHMRSIHAKQKEIVEFPPKAS